MVFIGACEMRGLGVWEGGRVFVREWVLAVRVKDLGEEEVEHFGGHQD